MKPVTGENSCSGLQFIELACAVAQSICRETHAVEHGEEQVVEGRILWINHVPTGVDPTRTAPRQKDRKIVVVVAVAITNRTAVNDHRVIENCAVSFFHRIKFFEEVSELRDQVSIDFSQLFEIFGLLLVM